MGNAFVPALLASTDSPLLPATGLTEFPPRGSCFLLAMRHTALVPRLRAGACHAELCHVGCSCLPATRPPAFGLPPHPLLAATAHAAIVLHLLRHGNARQAEY